MTACCDRPGVAHQVTPADLGTLEVMSFTTYGWACAVPELLVAEFVEICLTLFAEKKSPPALFAGLGEVLVQLSARLQGAEDRPDTRAAICW